MEMKNILTISLLLFFLSSCNDPSVTSDDGNVDVTTDDDGDGFSEADGDCNDANASVFPGAVESCNALDDDCDGNIDNDTADASTWYADADADGWGTDETMESCAQPEGYSSKTGDCDDNDASLSPADLDGDGVSTCDGDCDDTNPDDMVDNDGDGFSACQGDCDDTNPDDMVDNDADGFSICEGDCDDTNATDMVDTAEYQPYFIGLDIPDSLKCAYAANAKRFIENLSGLLYDFRNPLWTIHQNGEWVIYFYIESWEGPVTDVAINNLTNEYESLANQWLEGLTDFDPDAPDTVSIKVFGFVFQDSVQIDPSFYNTYGNYPIVTHSEASEFIPWELNFPNGDAVAGWLGNVVDFDSLQVVGNDAVNFPSATFSPTNWDTYTHPEGVDMPYTRFGHKTDWYAVGGRDILWIGGLISDYPTGETSQESAFTHEMGHCFFHDDIYDRVKYPFAEGLVSVMNSGNWGEGGPQAYYLEHGTYITDFDRVIMRIVWEAQKNQQNIVEFFTMCRRESWRM